MQRHRNSEISLSSASNTELNRQPRKLEGLQPLTPDVSGVFYIKRLNMTCRRGDTQAGFVMVPGSLSECPECCQNAKQENGDWLLIFHIGVRGTALIRCTPLTLLPTEGNTNIGWINSAKPNPRFRTSGRAEQRIIMSLYRLAHHEVLYSFLQF